MKQNIVSGILALIVGILGWQVVSLKNDNTQCIRHIQTLEQMSATKQELAEAVGSINTNMTAEIALSELKALEKTIEVRGDLEQTIRDQGQDYAGKFDLEMVSNNISWLQDRVNSDEKEALERISDDDREFARLWKSQKTPE